MPPATGIVAEIGIRINPNFSFDGAVGTANKFGIDEDTVFEKLPEWKAMKHIKITGIHVHSRSQELDGTLIAGYYAKMFELACRVQDALGEKLGFVNMAPVSVSPTPRATDPSTLHGSATR